MMFFSLAPVVIVVEIVVWVVPEVFVVTGVVVTGVDGVGLLLMFFSIAPVVIGVEIEVWVVPEVTVVTGWP